MNSRTGLPRTFRAARRGSATICASFCVLVLMTGFTHAASPPESDVWDQLRANSGAMEYPADRSQPRREKEPPPVAQIAQDDLLRTFQRGEITSAQYALQRAVSLFRVKQVRARFGNVAAPDPRHATIILRDLALRLGELSGKDRDRARRILARPTDGAADPFAQGYEVAEHSPPLCNANFCVHWVDTTLDAPPLVDTTPANGIPDWVETVQLVLQQVWDLEITQYGYRPPKSDATSPNNGGSGLLDVYLAQMGDVGIYGYCTTDDPYASPLSGYPFYDMSTFCVLDNDFSALEFPPAANGVVGLQITAAHEFFHAVQSAYDFFEDLWIIEGTATWMEDEFVDDSNDNFQFFPVTALRQSTVPVDLGGFGFEYGSWVFWRFLEEYFTDPADPGAGPRFIRRVWEWADGSPGAPDLYSSAAIENAAHERNSRLRHAFADFGAANFVPSSFYEEGASYPSPGAKRIKVSAGRPDTGWRKTSLLHLTNRYIMFTPGKGVTKKAKLAIDLDLPRLVQGSEATVVVMFKSGAVRFLPIGLSNAGDGFRRVNFNRKTVAGVVLVLTNASTRFHCWQIPPTPYSCYGAPMDDGRRFYYAARLVQ
jgi:hypothetical protein